MDADYRATWYKHEHEIGEIRYIGRDEDSMPLVMC